MAMTTNKKINRMQGIKDKDQFFKIPFILCILLNFLLCVMLLMSLVGCSGAAPTAPTPTPAATAAPPAREQIVKSLVDRGFSKGVNDNHYTHARFLLAAFIGDGCDFSIILKSGVSRPGEQIGAVKSLLASLYPKEVAEYFDGYITDLLNNALQGGKPLNAPMLETSGFTVGLGSPSYDRAVVLLAVFNEGGAYSQK
jgi:hypothetical protein